MAGNVPIKGTNKCFATPARPATKAFESVLSTLFNVALHSKKWPLRFQLRSDTNFRLARNISLRFVELSVYGGHCAYCGHEKNELCGDFFFTSRRGYVWQEVKFSWKLLHSFSRFSRGNVAHVRVHFACFSSNLYGVESQFTVLNK